MASLMFSHNFRSMLSRIWVVVNKLKFDNRLTIPVGEGSDQIIGSCSNCKEKIDAKAEAISVYNARTIRTKTKWLRKRDCERRSWGYRNDNNVSMKFCPKPPDTRHYFQRVNLPGKPIIRIEYVFETSRSTNLAIGDVRVYTAEHVLAYQIDNLLLTNLEPPVGNGSSDIFVKMIDKSCAHYARSSYFRSSSADWGNPSGLVHLRDGAKDKIAVLLGVTNAKFRYPARPGYVLILKAKGIHFSSKCGRVKDEAYVDGKLAAEAEISFALVNKSQI
ncbi:hypothetical protein ACTFIW_000976 [Dictyostelium discoideum]